MGKFTYKPQFGVIVICESAQDWEHREFNTPIELWTRQLAPLGVRLMASVINDIAKGRIVRQSQNEKFATFC